MTAYLFDTNIASYSVKPDAQQSMAGLLGEVERRLREQGALAISVVTQYELRRGVRKLLLHGKGKTKAAKVEHLIRTADVLGLDLPLYAGWGIAAEIWAHAGVAKPAVTIPEADLLVAATAAFHQRTLVTSDRTLAANLEATGFPLRVDVVEVA